MKQFKLNAIRTLGLALSTLILHACGPQEFVKSTNSSGVVAAGNMVLPAKVDIVMGISMTGSMGDIYPGMTSEIPAFVQGLQSSGWDYRFVTLPLTEYVDTSSTSFSINHAVSVSHYDSNYSLGSWLAPFPGASPTTAGLGIGSSFFSQIFILPSAISAPYNDGHEAGIRNEVGFVNRTDIRNNFLRSDATLAIINVSNYDDKSGGSWAASGSGSSLIWSPGADSDLNAFKSSLISLKGSLSRLKYYSLNSHYGTTNCRGSNANAGIRYEQMAQSLGTAPVDICTNTLSQSLSAVASDLQSAKLNFQKAYLIVGNRPNVSSIVVTKYVNGLAGNALTIPNDPVNGWTYSCPTCDATGYGTVFTVDSPVNMNQETGYVISLHGSAKLHGNDTANVTYLNY